MRRTTRRINYFCGSEPACLISTFAVQQADIHLRRQGGGEKLLDHLYRCPRIARQLASLVAAGLPLERTLSALSEEADTPAKRDLLAQVRSEVNAGAPLA